MVTLDSSLSIDPIISSALPLFYDHHVTPPPITHILPPKLIHQQAVAKFKDLLQHVQTEEDLLKLKQDLEELEYIFNILYS